MTHSRPEESDPWAPPADPGPDPVARWGPPLGTWAVCGAVVGTAVGMGLAMGQGPGSTASGGLVGLACGLLGGGLALKMDGARAGTLPPLPGRGAAPVHGAVFALPLLGVIPALLLLGVVVTVMKGHLLPLIGAGMLTVMVAWSLVRVWSNHRLVIALQCLGAGQDDAAHVALHSLAEHPLASARARALARANLGLLLLSQGDLTGAARWLATAEVVPAAQVGLAVALTGLNRLDEAVVALDRARSLVGARTVQAEIDAARVLVLWRTQGPEQALELALRLDNPAAGRLFHELLAHLSSKQIEQPSALMRRLLDWKKPS